jgi:tRNA1(Val) A37 N6-methylase TrmN6
MPNRVRNVNRFHISYNNHAADYGCATTALVLNGRVFFVLNGDHVCEMIDAAERHGIQGCVDTFIERINDANDRSEHRMAAGPVADPFGFYRTAFDVIGQGNVDRIAEVASR